MRHTSKFGGSSGLKDRYCIKAKEVSVIDGKLVGEPIDRLAEYENLEEQGLLLRVPCKVGDVVYRINTGCKEPIIPMKVTEISFRKREKYQHLRIDCIGEHDLGESCYYDEYIGDKLYLTREEAEKALEKMKGDSCNG